MRRALITGIAGQDGFYLTDLLLKHGYEVFGIIRRHSGNQSEIGHLGPFIGHENLHLIHGDITDYSSIEAAFHKALPHEVYNLAAQSHVRVSFDMPQFTVQVNALGTLNMLEATRKVAPYARFYQASTSEMFGNQIDIDKYQRESTPLIPVSPYGASKLFGHNMVMQYRNSYGLHASSGILFNHESPKRGGNFVTQKVVQGAVRIKHGLQNKLTLGNLDAYRDWGHAYDYTKAMWLMLQQDTPDDYVIATGEARSIKYLVQRVFDKLGMDWPRHVELVEFEKRPEDVNFLRGDATKAMRQLGWKPNYSFGDLIDEMISAAEADLTEKGK